METAIFWKTPAHLIVYDEDSAVEPPLNMADYSGSHIEKWADAQKKHPDLKWYEYDDFPRGRLIWDDNGKAYYFYADKRFLNDAALIDAVLRQIGTSRADYPFHFQNDSRYRVGNP